MTENEMKEKLQDLFNQNIPVYSYSKLTTWEHCKYNYYQNYILHNKSNDNVYTKIGTVIHDGLENLYNKNNTLENMEKAFYDELASCEKVGIKFPENPPTTKINYLNNMKHFFNNYKQLDINMKTEYFILYRIPRVIKPITDKDYIWIQMKIDSIIPVCNDEGQLQSVIINDWKTSSKFTKDKLTIAGKQLLLYKLGVEQVIGIPVSKIGWTMLKYVYCCYMTKGSKKNPPQLKQSMQERKDCVKYFHKKLVGDFIDSGMDNIDAEMKASQIINANDLSLLPSELKNKYWITDCFLEYEFNNDIINNCIEWVKKTVNDIESITQEKDYIPITINEKTNYFCFNLCGRPHCKYLEKYKYENIDKFKKDKKEKELDSLFVTDKKNTILSNIDSLFK